MLSARPDEMVRVAASVAGEREFGRFVSDLVECCHLLGGCGSVESEPAQVLMARNPDVAAELRGGDIPRSADSIASC